MEMVGKLGRVTGAIAPGKTGEVLISVRGGTEAFLAHAADSGRRPPNVHAALSSEPASASTAPGRPARPMWTGLPVP